MKNVWKNPIIDIMVFVTVIVAVSYIMFILIGSTPVWADTNTDDVYEIPEDYKSRNYVVQGRRQVNSDYKYIYDDTYDFTIYYPSNFYCSLVVRQNRKNDFYFWFSSKTDSEHKLRFSFPIDNALRYDENNIARVQIKLTVDKVDYSYYVYLKKNICTEHYLSTLSGSHISEGDKSLDLSSITGNYAMSDYTFFSINFPFIFQKYSSYDKYIYSGIYDSKYMVQNIPCSTNDTFATDISAIRAVEKRIENNQDGTFSEPTLKTVRKLTSSNIQCQYEYPTQGRTPNFGYVYPKIYLKVDGKEWVEYSEFDSTNKTYPHVFILNIENNNNFIYGNLSLNAIYMRMGYTWAEICSDNFIPPKIQGIIWGVQYGYALTQNILDESSIRKSKIVFSRYVFEDNIVDTPDVGIGDLGDLPNISGSTSNIEVGTGSNRPSGGSTNRPGMGQNVPDKDSTSFIDLIINGKLNFSSIGEALSSLFSMVSGFASAVGSVLGAVFGNTFGLIALCAMGAVIVLRVLGR